MKIDAVELTLFAWDDIPPTKYTQGTQNLSGHSSLGLLRLRTDAGIDGHAFLGSATNPAEDRCRGADAAFSKPLLLGKDRWGVRSSTPPCAAGNGIRDCAPLAPAIRRSGTLPPKPRACRSRLLGQRRSAIGAYASSQVLDSVAAYAEEAAQFRPMAGKPTRSILRMVPRLDIKGVRGRAQGGWRRLHLMLDSTWSYRYPEALKVGRAIERLGFLWYEDPSQRGGHLRLRQARA
jgi:hypothetical protein